MTTPTALPGKYRLLACKVFEAEVENILAKAGLSGRHDIHWLEMELHEQPEKLRAELTRLIKDSEGKGYAAVVLLFGLCSNASVGLEPPADSQLVIPKAHDCITLYLGSAESYAREHRAEAGTYWFSRGFINRDREKGGTPAGHGANVSGLDYSPARRAEIYRNYVEQYGEENADYLMEVLVDSWKKNYTRAVYLRWSENPAADADRDYTASFAKDNGWRFEEMPANLRLVEALLGGVWPEDEFLVLGQGQRVAASYDELAIRAERT